MPWVRLREEIIGEVFTQQMYTAWELSVLKYIYRYEDQRRRDVVAKRLDRKSQVTHCVVCGADLNQPFGEPVPAFRPRLYCGVKCKRVKIYERRKLERKRLRENRKKR